MRQFLYRYALKRSAYWNQKYHALQDPYLKDVNNIEAWIPYYKALQLHNRWRAWALWFYKH